MVDLEAIVTALAVACLVAFLIHRYVQYLNEKKNAAKQGILESSIQNEEIANSDELCIRIIFGTQTGTSEKLAKELRGRIAEVYNHESLKVVVEDIENYNAQDRLHNEKYVFFFTATYGDGEPTDTAVDFDTWLTESKEIDEETLHSVKYGVMALGNREYEHFCVFGKKVDRIMEKLGAQRIAKRVDGDDSKCIEDDFDNFAKNVMEALEKEEILQELKKETCPQKLTPDNVPAYKVVVYSEDNVEQSPQRPTGHMTHMARIATVRELHTERSDRSCLHVELDISDVDVIYETGDHVALLPENCSEIVEAAGASLGVSLDTVFSLEIPESNPQDLEAPFPGPVTLRNALSKYADLTNPPQKSSLKMLSAFATDPIEAEKLILLASPEGRDEFNQFVHNNAMSLLELMQAFPSAKPNLGSFFGCICPRIQPRYYSISSSPFYTPGHIHITAAVIHEKKPTGKIHKGVCTNWLSIQSPGSLAPMHIRRSHFKLPSDPNVPIVMVGPGTGIAPFRGFLQHRASLAAKGSTLGPALLFFGCRNREMDYIYQEELEGYVNDGTLTALHVAFSRETDRKIYVQHKLLENSTFYFILNEFDFSFRGICLEVAN